MWHNTIRGLTFSPFWTIFSLMSFFCWCYRWPFKYIQKAFHICWLWCFWFCSTSSILCFNYKYIVWHIYCLEFDSFFFFFFFRFSSFLLTLSFGMFWPELTKMDLCCLCQFVVVSPSDFLDCLNFLWFLLTYFQFHFLLRLLFVFVYLSSFSSSDSELSVLSYLSSLDIPSVHESCLWQDFTHPLRFQSIVHSPAMCPSSKHFLQILFWLFLGCP